MLYLGIDQHKNHLTINVRNEQGDVLQKGQVSTDPADIDDFFGDLVKKARKHRGYMAIVEVCGFNDWLLEKLKQTQCNEIVVIQPASSALNKTDKRDADALGAFLWNNRAHLRDGQRPDGIHRIVPAESADAEVRQLANLRQRSIRHRTMTINKIKGIINKHNLSHDAPTEDSSTQKFRKWIKAIELPVTDRFEVNRHIKAQDYHNEEIIEIESELVKRVEASEARRTNVYRLKAIPGISGMGAIILLSRIGDITRFKNPKSLANYFGLTPGCHNTAGKHRVGGITKRGNAIARNVLNFAVNHVIRKDPEMKAWYKKIKNKKGTKTARVAVMRRLATIIWHIVRWGKPYQFRYDPPSIASKEVFEGIDNRNQSKKREGTPRKCKSKTKA